MPGSAVRANVGDAIERLALGPLLKTELVHLVPHARRALLVAAALATGAETIAIEDPFGGLADEAVAGYAPVLTTALAERRWLVFAPRIPRTSPLVLVADEAIIVSRGRIVAQGAPASVIGRAVRQRFSGCLAFEVDQGLRRIVFKDGDVVIAVSAVHGESLVSFLAQRGDLTPETATQIEHRIPAFGRHAGAALIARGLLEQNELWPVLRAHAEWVLALRAIERSDLPEPSDAARRTLEAQAR